MKQKIQISIPKPCHESWQNMTPVEKGRFCSSCQKTVLDFTHLSDNEIIKLVSKNDNLCVRLKENQIHRNNIETKRASNFFGYIAITVLTFLGLGVNNVVAQEKPSIEQKDSRILNKVIDSKKKITISGIVTNEKDGNPIRGVAVLVKGSKNYVLTDENGKYSIEVKKGKKLVFSHVNYEEQTVKVNSTTLNLKLKKEEMLIGQVIIE